jgi:hypothetical protein
MALTSFFRKSDMKTSAEQAGHPVLVSFDHNNNKNKSVQKFCHFASHTDFMGVVLDDTNTPCFYEIIAENKPCKLYFDIEWVEVFALDSNVFFLCIHVNLHVFIRFFAGDQQAACRYH